MGALACLGLRSHLFYSGKPPIATQDHDGSISRVCRDVAILNVCLRNDLSRDPLRRYCFQLESLARRHRAIRRPRHESDYTPGVESSTSPDICRKPVVPRLVAGSRRGCHPALRLTGQSADRLEGTVRGCASTATHPTKEKIVRLANMRGQMPAIR